MPAEALASIDDYEVFLTERLSPWSPQQRLALAAGIAERWLPAYENFSAEENWGDAASLRRSLDAIWGHIRGSTLRDRDLSRHIAQLEDITPHLDDFDAEDAITACAILHDALQMCGDPDNGIPYIVRLALGILESLVGEWPIDPAAQRRAWQKTAVRKELQAHWKLLEEIGTTSSFDSESVKALRGRIVELKLKAAKRPKPKATPGLTNQTAFEQYRRYLESDLKGQVKGQPDPDPNSFIFAITYLGYWLGRYSRRMQTINGSYGRLADEPGQRAVIACNRARDAADKGIPNWDREVVEAFEMCLKNNSQLKVLDAGTVETPHAYGPSLRRLWLEGRRSGTSAQDGWRHIRQWASHRATAWEAEDSRKKKGLAHATPELGEKLAQELLWTSTTDPEHPWTTDVGGATWRVRVNDFPDELMYGLIIGDTHLGDFHDWPETWRRS